MTTDTMISIATLESALTRDQCKLCERNGVPIFVARQALVPTLSNNRAFVPQGPSETTLGWRTLRTGYLYVLLDRQNWQAYQVSADGYLRRFDPYVPPTANNFLLPEKCTAADHDCPSSFISIDIDKHNEAWLAFASDPWTAHVLQNYKAGRGNDRFQVVDLRKLRDNPGIAGMFMTPDEPGLDKDVFEYQLYVPGRFNSAHAFYSRAARLQAMGTYVKASMERYAMPKGIPVVAIEDALGMVEEYNHQRNAWVHARQKWMADPDRAYQHQTSQILLAIRRLHRNWAAEQLPPGEAPKRWDHTPIHIDYAKDNARAVEAKARGFDDRLEQRYDEAQRAKFQKAYDTEFARYQHQIDLMSQGYAEALKDLTFIAAEEYDYDGGDFDSARAYAITMAQCLRGGIHEAPVAVGEQDTGPVALQWKAWLENPQSPIYRALLLRDSNLLAGLLPSFRAEGEAQWSDSVRLYDALTKAISSDEGDRLQRAVLREAVADLQGTLNAVSARLVPTLIPSIQHVVSRVNTATQLLYNGIHLVELKVSIKLGEYYALQSEHLRNLQRQATEAMANAPRRTVSGLMDLEAQWAEEKARKVVPIILGGVLNLAALEPIIASETVKVSIWVEGTASDVRQTLALGANLGIEDLRHNVNAILQTVSVGVNTLEPKVRQIFEGLRITSQQATGLVREGLTGLRGATGSAPVLISVGTLYLLTDVMKRNFEAVSEVIGDKSPEARVAFYGSAVGVTGGAVELVGLAMEKGANKALEANRLAARGMGAAKDIKALGNALSRLGATMGAATGVYDAVIAGMAINRSLRSGDKRAGVIYSASLLAFSISTFFGTLTVALATTTFLGLLGGAIGFGLLGYILFKLAEGRESTLLEVWTRRCFFGYHNETPPIHWAKAEDFESSTAALNAATLGAEAGISLGVRLRGIERQGTDALGSADFPEYERYLEYSLMLPFFNPERSAYLWTVTAHYEPASILGNYITDKILIQQEFGSPPMITITDKYRQTLPTSDVSANPDYHAENKINLDDLIPIELPNGSSAQIKRFAGSMSMIDHKERRVIKSATLSVIFWPDRAEAEGYIKITNFSTS